MKNNIYKKFSTCVLLLLLSLVYITTIQGKTILNKGETEKYLDKIAAYEMDKVKSPTCGSIGGEWLVTGLSRYGVITDDYISIYKSNLKKRLKECNGVLSERKYTEYSRVVIALTAIGEKPETFAGYNLIQPLAELDNVKLSGANGVVYALIALDCGNYSIPDPKSSYNGKKTTRDKLIQSILDNQLPDGGWAIAGKNADVDMTAMAIQALTPYDKKNERVSAAIHSGLNCLGKLQESDGSFKSGGKKNCNSTSQVLMTMSELNIKINDERFVKNDNTVIDGLLQFYSGGGFKHLENTLVNQMATEQAMYALTSYYRNICGMNRFYSMSDGIVKRTIVREKVNTNKNVGRKQTRNKNKKKNETNTIPTLNKSERKTDPKDVETFSQKIETSTANRKVKRSKNKDNKVAVTDKLPEEMVSIEKNSTESKGEEYRQNRKNKSFFWMILVVILPAGAAMVYYLFKKKKMKTLGLFFLVFICIGTSGCKKAETKSSEVGTCTIMVECSTVFDNLEKLDKSIKDFIPENGVIIEKREVPVYENDNVYEVLNRELKKDNILMEASFTGSSAYIEGIDNIYEFSCGDLSGWEYCVNGVYSNTSCSEYNVKDGDAIEWHYTCNLGEDLKN